MTHREDRGPPGISAWHPLCGAHDREQGQASVEFAGLLTLVLACFLAALQLLLAGYCAVVEDGATRAAARAASRGGDATAAAHASMPDWLAGRTTVQVRGEQVVLTTRIPALIPGLSLAALHSSATFPRT
jgi:hypothetical protein